jgi:hypothetical protein
MKHKKIKYKRIRPHWSWNRSWPWPGSWKTSMSWCYNNSFVLFTKSWNGGLIYGDN